MFWGRKEEETFKPKKKLTEEGEIEEERKEQPSTDSIIERLETITQRINLISRYLTNISKRVSKAMDASVAYQKDLDELERRIELIRSRIEELENIAPEVRLEKELGKKAA
jgi:prefoldin subunit 5